MTSFNTMYILMFVIPKMLFCEENIGNKIWLCDSVVEKEELIHGAQWGIAA